MALFKDWQDFADKKSAEPGAEQYWTQYFLREKDFYEKLLKGEAPYRRSLTTSAWISSK